MKGNIEAVYCELKYSRVGPVFFAAASACTLALLAATPLPVGLRAALILYVASIAMHAWGSLRRVRGLRADVLGNIEFKLRDGRLHRGTLRDGSIVAPWLTLVRWRPEGGRWDRAVVVLPDMVDPGHFRRLRVILRWWRADPYCGSGSSQKSKPGRTA